MFSSVKSLMLVKSFIKVCRCCTKGNSNILGCLRNFRSTNGARRYNQIRFLSHPPKALGATDSERENPADSLEEAQARRRPEQIKIIYDVVKTSKYLSEEELHSFRENVLGTGNVVNDSNIDAVVMGVCSSLKNMEFANRYLSFLENRNSDINIATMSRYMKLCYICGQVEDESTVINTWHNLKEKLPLMDASTAENIIHGLSVTSEWNQGLELLNVVKETGSPSASTYSALIVSAFRNRNVQVGWNLMEECIQEKKPLDRVYLVWLDEYCTLGKDSNMEHCMKMAEKLLNFLSCHEISVSNEVIRKLKHTFEKMKWKCQYTYINERGACTTCKGEMIPIFISKSEFQALSKTFLEKVLVGPDVFTKSSPEEVKAFQELIAKEAPYNTVIDGLNVAYSGGVERRGSRTSPASLLQNVVAHFVDLSHKILVLGRTHMNAWPRKEMDYIKKNSQLFLAENISQDDPFLLYAAMSSGPGTCFLSRDLMRSHAYRLKCADPSLATIFHRWQISHQMRLLGVSQNSRVIIKPPLEFLPTVQKVGGNWHIPCQEEDGAYPVGRSAVVPNSHLDPPTTWLCLSPKGHGAKQFKKSYGEWSRNYD